jgi:hypothetical protein
VMQRVVACYPLENVGLTQISLSWPHPSSEAWEHECRDN